MQTSFQRMPARRLAELRGYVAWGTAVFRAAVFAAAIAAVAWLLRAVHLRLGRPLVDSELFWMVPSLALAVTLYRVSRRWTGGAAFRRAVRADLARGEMAVHRVVAVDAVEVEEGKDEGPSYFVLTDDGTTLLFTGQYLATCKRKGFPWRTFEILEAPASKIFFGLSRQGEPLVPSAVRPPLSWSEFKEFAQATRDYGVVDVDFAALKEGYLRPSVRR